VSVKDVDIVTGRAARFKEDIPELDNEPMGFDCKPLSRE
jgi:hypothetical protein